MYVTRSCLTTDTAKTLIHAFVSSRLDYCNLLLVGIADYVIQKLQRVQNTAARMITGTRKFNHVTSILQELHWLLVTLWIQYKIAGQQMSVGPSNPYLAKLCRPVIHLTGHWHLRSAASRKLDMQRTATAFGYRNFAVSSRATWNSLPAELRLSTLSMATFARRLKVHLFFSTEWHVLAAHLNLFKSVLFINFIIIIWSVGQHWLEWQAMNCLLPDICLLKCLTYLCAADLSRWHTLSSWHSVSDGVSAADTACQWLLADTLVCCYPV